MNYIILDLEWNNTYCKKKKGFFNEIIEIGAVKLNDRLEVTDTFSSFIKVQITKKLHSRVKELTHITNDDIVQGVPFSQTMSNFRKWVSSEPNIILTWGDTDIRVLIENFKYFNGISFIPFLSNFVNLQKYADAFLNVPDSQQISLAHAAEKLEINFEQESLHRALGDSMLTADIFKKIYNEHMLSSYTHVCDPAFYTRLSFKARYITDINHPLIDKSKMCCFCDCCGEACERISEWTLINKAFRSVFRCNKCKRKMRFTIRFKEFYDRVDVKFSAVPLIEKKEIKSVVAVESQSSQNNKEN